MSELTPLALLQAGDVDGLLALHRSTFGDAKMSTPAGDPAALAQGAAESGQGQQQSPLQLVPQNAPMQPAQTFQPVGRTFTEADIETARKQEKDKLYPQLEQVQEELKRLREAEQERTRLAAEAEEARKAAETEQQRLAREAAEAEMSAKELLELQRQEWEQKFAGLQQEREAERRILEMERRHSDLMTYKTQALQANSEEIIPELADELLAAQHASREEIDAHIDRLRGISARIIEQATGAAQQQRQNMRGVPVTAPPALGPTDNPSGHQSYSPQEIAAMSYTDYAKNRDKLLGAVSQSRSNERGLYG